MKTVAENFRRLREKRGLSQQQVADSIGVSVSMVSRLETNPKQLKLDYIVRFASFYEIPLGKLFSKKEDKFKRRLAKIKVQVTLPSEINNSAFLFELARYLQQSEELKTKNKLLCKSLH